MKDARNLLQKLPPLLLIVIVVAADQITKLIIVKTIPPFTVGASFFGGILRIVHVANTGVAFSVGDTLPETIRRFLFAIVPLVVIVLVLVVYFRNNIFTRLQRWCICGIVGGGLGNLIDRFLRREGVVDFIDVDIPDIRVLNFELTRWPTFNVADASIVVCGAILFISFLIVINKEEKINNGEKQNATLEERHG